MRFSVDAWDPGYGSSLADAAESLEASGARVSLDVETPEGEWAPIRPSAVAEPSAVLFVDGVRRIDARVWIAAGNGSGSSMGVCASYAAGVVCCCDEGAHLTWLDTRRGLFATDPQAEPVATRFGGWPVALTAPDPASPAGVTLSLAVQRKLADLEAAVATNARGERPRDDDLLVLDGPLRGRTRLPRAVSLIKSHQSVYLPPQLAGIVGALDCHERTPVFLLGTTWERYTWYVRLPCAIESSWHGIVRLECSTEREPAEAIALATLTQAVLPRYASEAHKDARSPQNLYPIAGLEQQLRHRLGDTKLLWRGLREAASSGTG